MANRVYYLHKTNDAIVSLTTTGSDFRMHHIGNQQATKDSLYKSWSLNHDHWQHIPKPNYYPGNHVELTSEEIVLVYGIAQKQGVGIVYKVESLDSRRAWVVTENEIRRGVPSSASKKGKRVLILDTLYENTL